MQEKATECLMVEICRGLTQCRELPSSVAARYYAHIAAIFSTFDSFYI